MNDDKPDEPTIVPAQEFTPEIIVAFEGTVQGQSASARWERECVGIIVASKESALLGDFERVYWELQTKHEPHGLYAVLASGSCDGRETAKKQIRKAVDEANQR